MKKIFTKKLNTGFLLIFSTFSTYSSAQNMSLSVITPVCGNNTGSVQVSFTGITYPFILYWSGNGAVKNGKDTITASPQTITMVGNSGYKYNLKGYTANFYTSIYNFGAYGVGINCSQIQNLTVNCAGGQLNVSNLNGGTGPYTISLIDMNNNSTIVSGSIPLNMSYSQVCPISNNRAALRITDVNGCYAHIDSFHVTCTGLTMNLSGTVASCSNGTASIDTVYGGIPPYTYLWSNSATTRNLTGLISGSYSCIASDSNGCSSFNKSVYIAQSPVISGTFSSTTATCTQLNGSATVTPGGGKSPYSYLWDNNATTASVSNLSGGSHKVLVTDANGCFAKLSIFINTTNPMNVTYTQLPGSCSSADGKATLKPTGGTSPYTYKWYGYTSTADSLVNMPAGTYSFLVKDAGGCEKNGTVIILPKSQVNSEIYVTHAVCPNNNGTVTLYVSGNGAPFTYLWNNNSTSAGLTGMPPDTYTCTITDVNGCKVIKSAIINQTSSIKPGFSTVKATCLYDTNGQIIMTVKGGVKPYTYKWSNGKTTGKLTNLAAGPYSVTIKDSVDCEIKAYVNVGYLAYKTCYCTLTGRMYRDTNANCKQDPGEEGVVNSLVKIGNEGYVVTNEKGDYSIKLKKGNYGISAVLNANLALSSCQSNNVQVTMGTGAGCVDSVRFAMKLTPYHDIQIMSTSARGPVPGRTSEQLLVIKNNGNIKETDIRARYINDGQLDISSYNKALWAPANSNFPEDLTMSSPLTLQPGGGQSFWFYFYTPTSLTINTVINFKDTASYKNPLSTFWKTNEGTPSNNIQNLNVKVRSSYDPNSKEVYPAGDGAKGEIELSVKDFRYVVNFENNGNFNAQKVVVIDTLDADLDLETFSILYHSHPVFIHISEKRVLTFTFDNINLDYTPVGVDNPFAKGVVAYSIKAKNSVVEGTRLSSRAGIYFDYNAPVNTNAPINTYIKSASVNQQKAQKPAFDVYPNPAGDILNLVLQAESYPSTRSIEIFNMKGQLVLNKVLENTIHVSLNISSLEHGIYYIRLSSGNGMNTGVKFIKS